MMIIPTQSSPAYIKKEDVKDYLEDKRKVIPFILVMFTLMAGFLEYMMYILTLPDYARLNLQPSPLLTISPYITGVGVIFFLGIAIYLWFSEPYYEKALSNLDKYKDQDMINTKEIKVENTKWIWINLLFFLGLLLLIVLYQAPKR